MPKIRLTAIASDIKGKANGSVFSKNNGGIYFRNNPSGGGKKSAKWDKQKGGFSSLSTNWRSLTIEQQNAWNDAVTSYPTTNAFGELRYPSGYQLFMRLNGTLKAMGLPILVTPNSPRTTPSPGIVELNYPDQWQLNPKAALRLFNPNNFSDEYGLTCFNLLESGPLLSDKTISFRTLGNKTQSAPVTSASEFIVYECMNVNDYGLRVVFKNVTSDSFTVSLLFLSADGIWIGSSSYSENVLQNSVHLAIVFTSSDFDGVELYINGTPQDLTPEVISDPSNPTGEFQQRFSFGETGYPYAQFLSDYRLYFVPLSSDNVKLISRGYVLETEQIICDFITHSGNQFINYGILGASYNFSYSGAIPVDQQITPVSFFLIPNFSLYFENEGLEGLFVNIYASPPTSNGKTGSFSNYKLVGSYEWNTGTVFDFYNDYRAIYSNVPPSSQVVVVVDIIDTTTGACLSKKKKTKKKDVRFKAGADLTDKVN